MCNEGILTGTALSKHLVRRQRSKEGRSKEGKSTTGFSSSEAAAHCAFPAAEHQVQAQTRKEGVGGGAVTICTVLLPLPPPPAEAFVSKSAQAVLRTQPLLQAEGWLALTPS